MSTKKVLGVAAFTAALAAGGVAGALLGSPAFSGAQEAGTTAPTTVQESPAPPADPNAPAAPDDSTRPAKPADGSRPAHDPKMGGHVGSNGVKEELLTGDTADKVTAAALAANPGATIDRVETDADGATYEAHITKADGSHATVLFDANFNVTGTEDGPGPR
jgi:hypothetical protein